MCMRRNGAWKRMLAVLLAAAVGGMAGCGGDDDKASDAPSASQTQATTTSTTAQSDGSAGGDRSGDSPAGGTSTDGASPKTGSGGSHAPRTRRSPRKKSLQRYLAKNYRQTPWYPLMRKLVIAGGHVTVYLTFPPESDDESPPVLACTAVLSYGRQVKNVTVYGSATPQGQSVPIKEC